MISTHTHKSFRALLLHLAPPHGSIRHNVILLGALVLLADGCSVLSARPGDGDAVLGLKCAGTATLIVGTALVAVPFIHGAIRRGTMVGPCDTLMGIEDPNVSHAENVARFEGALHSYAETNLVNRGGAVISNPDGSKSYIGSLARRSGPPLPWEAGAPLLPVTGPTF
jgi:hypothetical protein